MPYVLCVMQESVLRPLGLSFTTPIVDDL